MSIWTEDDDALLCRYALANCSFADAAAALGRTRSMVAGRAHRLRLVFNCSAATISEKARANAIKAWAPGGYQRRRIVERTHP